MNAQTEDRLDGAEAIGAYLGWPPRKVYRAREESWSLPIRKMKGLGLYAFRSELDAWLKSPDTLNVTRN